MFDENNFETKLLEFHDTYYNYVNNMSNYPNTAEVMVDNYLKYFELLLEKRDFIIERREQSGISMAALRLRFPI